MQLRKLAAAVLFAGLVSSGLAQVTLGWNFSDDNAIYDTGTPANFTLTGISIGNTLGTVADPILSQSVSSGYTGATGTFNIGNAVRIGALNTNSGGSAYFEVTFTPAAGYSISISDFDFGVRSTGTGAQAYSLRSSADNFASSIVTGAIANNSSWAFKDNTFLATSGSVDPLTLRLYVYGGAGSPASGTINTRLDDIRITLSASAVVAPIPEPSTYAAIFGGMALVGAVVYRRRQAAKV